MRHLVSLVDGTWLTPTVVAGGNINSNIFRINNFLKCQASDGNPQIVFYSRGLGAVSGIQKYTAGGFASNIKEEIEDTYINIASNYTEGDKIYLFGFSRGAVIARVVAGLISNAGLLSSWHLDKFPDIWALYKSGGMRDDEFPPEYCEPRAKVEFRVPMSAFGTKQTLRGRGVLLCNLVPTPFRQCPAITPRQGGSNKAVVEDWAGRHLAALPFRLARDITPLIAGLSRPSPAAAATKRGHATSGPAGRRRWAP